MYFAVIAWVKALNKKSIHFILVYGNNFIYLEYNHYEWHLFFCIYALLIFTTLQKKLGRNLQTTIEFERCSKMRTIEVWPKANEAFEIVHNNLRGNVRCFDSEHCKTIGPLFVCPQVIPTWSEWYSSSLFSVLLAILAYNSFFLLKKKKETNKFEQKWLSICLTK